MNDTTETNSIILIIHFYTLLISLNVKVYKREHATHKMCIFGDTNLDDMFVCMLRHDKTADNNKENNN